MRLIFLILVQISLFSTDYDCIIVGSSPFSIFEALYQSCSGQKVLIIEEADRIGGAWKTITICGVDHADLGCHQIGHDLKIKEFLEEYVGCKLVSLDHPNEPYDPKSSPNGYYFSKGCQELIDHLVQLIAHSNVEIQTCTKVENVVIDTVNKTAQVETNRHFYSTKKLIVTPMSCVKLTPTQSPQYFPKSKYYHLYMLIQDPNPSAFTYYYSVAPGMSRLMNLTPFIGLEQTGGQLIVIQTHDEQNLYKENELLESLKSLQLLSPGAYILKSEPYIYESGSLYQSLIVQMGAQEVVNVIQTGHFQNLNKHIDKWKTVLKPYREMVAN